MIVWAGSGKEELARQNDTNFSLWCVCVYENLQKQFSDIE
jgi:hypothetical protein